MNRWEKNIKCLGRCTSLFWQRAIHSKWDAIPLLESRSFENTDDPMEFIHVRRNYSEENNWRQKSLIHCLKYGKALSGTEHQRRTHAPDSHHAHLPGHTGQQEDLPWGLQWCSWPFGAVSASGHAPSRSLRPSTAPAPLSQVSTALLTSPSLLADVTARL